MSDSKTYNEELSSPHAILVNNTSPQPTLPIDIETSNLSELEELIENTLKIEVYNRARILCFLSIIDMTFLVINLIISIIVNDVSWVFFLFFPLCLSGYVGGRDYNRYMVMGYSCYLFIMSIIYLTIVFVYQSFLYLFLFFIQTYFLLYSLKFTRNLSRLNKKSLESLRDGWKPEDREIIVYYY